MKKLTLQAPALAEERLGFFRYGHLAHQVLLTNDAGEWQFLSEADFTGLLDGSLGEDHAAWGELHAKGFLRHGIDLDALADKVRRKKSWLGMGPHLHMVVTTLRCNQGCRYCHASRTDMDRVDTDMSLATAKKVVDFVMSSPSPYLCFEYQGGEPTVNMDAIQFIVQMSRERNREEGKRLEHSLVSNLTRMDEDKARWLVDNDVLLCTSLDGPQDLHDWNRTWAGTKNSAYDSVLHWMQWFNQAYIDKGRDPNLWHVDALMTSTRRSLGRARELVDLYVGLGIKNIRVRPLNHYGFALGTWKSIGYDIEEYLAFYEEVLDYVIELNRQGVEIIEGTAAIFLQKMLTPDDPNFIDLRSPGGAGLGGLAYNYDGGIFPSDEARMVDAMGNDAFRIGTVGVDDYRSVSQHPTVKALAVASLQDTLPACHTCWNKPFCGVDPMHSYMTSGDLWGQRPASRKCKEYMTISRLLLERLAQDESGELEAIFRRWTVQRPREA